MNDAGLGRPDRAVRDVSIRVFGSSALRFPLNGLVGRWVPGLILGLALGLGLGLGWVPVLAVDVPTKAKGEGGGSLVTDPWAAMFVRGAVTEFRLGLDEDAVRSLREQPRRYVSGMVGVPGRDPVRVAVRLKGGVGSFRPIEGKPSWTLDFSGLERGLRVGGVERLQWNNAVEDPGYLNEAVGSEVFAEAGIPMPRVAHARVILNGRELGLYVLKEGYTGAFLRRHFPGGLGALYDNDAGPDIDGPLHRGSASGHPAGRVEALALAVRETDPVVRWRRMGEHLDLDRFLTVLALEVLVGHRDGYGIARNNFRMYEDPGSGRVVFLPDGMDQLFGREEFPIRPRWGGVVARAVMETAEGRGAYDLRLADLMRTALTLGTLTQRVDRWTQELRPNLKDADWRILQVGAEDLKARMAVRDAWLRRQWAEGSPARPRFEKGVVLVRDWRPVDAIAAVRLDEGPAPDGIPSLRVEATRGTSASWRARVLLGAGRYRFEGRMRVDGVVPVAGLRTGGAGLRVQGMARSGPGLVGNTNWTLLRQEFEVAEPGREMELLCELVADAGCLWVDRDSLRLFQESGPTDAAGEVGVGRGAR